MRFGVGACDNLLSCSGVGLMICFLRSSRRSTRISGVDQFEVGPVLWMQFSFFVIVLVLLLWVRIKVSLFGDSCVFLFWMRFFVRYVLIVMMVGSVSVFIQMGPSFMFIRFFMV